VSKRWCAGWKVLIIFTAAILQTLAKHHRRAHHASKQEARDRTWRHTTHARESALGKPPDQKSQLGLSDRTSYLGRYSCTVANIDRSGVDSRDKTSEEPSSMIGGWICSNKRMMQEAHDLLHMRPAAVQPHGDVELIKPSGMVGGGCGMRSEEAETSDRMMQAAGRDPSGIQHGSKLFTVADCGSLRV